MSEFCLWCLLLLSAVLYSVASFPPIPPERDFDVIAHKLAVEAIRRNGDGTRDFPYLLELHSQLFAPKYIPVTVKSNVMAAECPLLSQPHFLGGCMLCKTCKEQGLCERSIIVAYAKAFFWAIGNEQPADCPEYRSLRYLDLEA